MPNFDLDQTAVKVNSAINQIIDTSTDLNIDNNTLVVDKSTNKVGVGTASPSYSLHVSNPSTNAEFKLQSSATSGSGSSRFYLDAKGGGELGEIHFMHEGTKKACIWHHTDSILHFKTGSGGSGGTGHLSIDASGNVRVDSGSWLSNVEGTEAIKFSTSNGLQAKTNSEERLRINTSGTILCKGVVQVQEVDGGSNAEIKFHPNSDDDFGRISWLKNNGSTVSAFLDHDSTNQDLRYFIDGSQKFTIDSSGNVGIGTTSLSMKLEVNGGLKIHQNNTYSITGSGGSETLNIANDGFIKIDQTSSAQDLYTITFNSGNPSAGQILLLKVDDGNTGAVTLKHSANQNGFNIGSDITLVQNGHKVIQLVHTGWAWSAIGHD